MRCCFFFSGFNFFSGCCCQIRVWLGGFTTRFPMFFHVFPLPRCQICCAASLSCLVLSFLLSFDSRWLPGVSGAMDRELLKQQTVETLLLWLLLVIRELCNRFRVDIDRVVTPPPAVHSRNPYPNPNVDPEAVLEAPPCPHQCRFCQRPCGHIRIDHTQHSCWTHRHDRWTLMTLTWVHGLKLMLKNQKIALSGRFAMFCKVKPSPKPRFSLDVPRASWKGHAPDVSHRGLAPPVITQVLTKLQISADRSMHFASEHSPAKHPCVMFIHVSPLFHAWWIFHIFSPLIPQQCQSASRQCKDCEYNLHVFAHDCTCLRHFAPFCAILRPIGAISTWWVN